MRKCKIKGVAPAYADEQYFFHQFVPVDRSENGVMAILEDKNGKIVYEKPDNIIFISQPDAVVESPSSELLHTKKDMGNAFNAGVSFGFSRPEAKVAFSDWYPKYVKSKV